MANRCALATGNFNTAGTWSQNTNTPTLHASTNVTVSVAGVTSATFTAPNTTNAANGLMVYLVAKGTATTITATLQEATVDTACTATITLSNVNAGTWICFKPTPYVFTATTAGRYRWKLAVDAGTTTTVAQASTADFAYLSWDDRASVPVSGDQIFLVGTNNATAFTVTGDGTQTWGNNVNSAASRSITNAMYISNGAIFKLDEAASCTHTHRGSIYVDVGGELNCGTTGTPLNSSYTATLIAATHNQGITVAVGGKSVLQGASKSTSYQTTYVSGAGTAASPLITAGDIGVVGDKIIIGAASNNATNYNETEVRYIITKNSATSYVVSTTSGGAEAALTYTHATGAKIGNFQRNIIIKGTSTVVCTGFQAAAQSATGFVNIDWVAFENLSNAAFLGAVPTNNVLIASNVEIDYCVGYEGSAGLFFFSGHTGTRTGLMAYNTQAAAGTATAFANIAVMLNSTVNLVDCISFASTSYGITTSTVNASTLTRCVAIASSGSSATYAGWAIDSANKNQFTNCESHCNRVSGIYLLAGAANAFTSCNFGTLGTNGTQDVYAGTGFSTPLFEDCTFGSSTLISNYANMTLGSEVAFSRYQDTDNQHRWYTNYGYGVSEDTVIRSPGLSVKLVPENLATGFTWSFQIPVAQYSVARFLGYFLKNATLGTDVVTVSMYLPDNPIGGGSPDATTTLSNTTGASFSVANEQAISLVANYTGSIPGVATVLVNVKSNTAGAYLYADDFFNAGDRTTTFDSVTGLNTWVNGKPVGVISPLVPSAADTAAAVWGAATSTNNTAGTMGRLQNKALTVAKFLGLK